MPRHLFYPAVLICIAAVLALVHYAKQAAAPTPASPAIAMNTSPDKHSANANTGATDGAAQQASQTADTGRHDAPARDKLRAQLSPLQYEVVCNEATEPPFRNAYWDNKEAGIYVDIVSGKPLFSSRDKFDSGTGWPSFTRALDAEEIVEKTDSSHGMTRTEVRSKSGKAHLGHLFPDGPAPTGMRYCINSASLRFIPVAELEAQGYGEYKALFQ